MEYAHEDIPISNWKESISELTSQQLEVVELLYKPYNNILELIIIYIILLY
jgi:hypothetical protein